MDSWEKLHNFMKSFAAAVELNSRAAKQGCFVECVVLSAAVIDATLRMGLILKHQLDTSSNSLLDYLLHQEEADKGISERHIYKESLSNQIIDQATFDKLNNLYNRRNRVIHRYCISLITTKDVLDIASEYDELKHEVSAFVEKLEKEQIRLGVEMTSEGGTGDIADQVRDLALGKHGDDGLANALRNGI
jgi:uncharacterized protein YutE (UPF0331/DUF86 family)